MNTKYKVIKGAIEKDTGKFILPQFSLKDIFYKCFDTECGRDIIKVDSHTKTNGTKVDTYFKHKNKCDCKRYSLNTNLTESEIHKEGILNLKYILENNEISKRVRRCCPSCGINQIIDKEIDNLEQNECIKIEYSFKYNGRNLTADIAKLTDGKITQIYEIKHTHPTKEEDRPADIEWYEIDAQLINEQISKMTKEDDREIILECLRQTQLCPSCLIKKQENERFKKEEQERCNAIKKKELEKQLKQQELERCNAIKKKELEQQELERCNAVKQDKNQERKGWNSNWYNKEYGNRWGNNQQMDDEEREEQKEERRQLLIDERIKRNNFLKYRQELFLKSKEEKSIKEQEQKLI